MCGCIERWYDETNVKQWWWLVLHPSLMRKCVRQGQIVHVCVLEGRKRRRRSKKENELLSYMRGRKNKCERKNEKVPSVWLCNVWCFNRLQCWLLYFVSVTTSFSYLNGKSFPLFDVLPFTRSLFFFHSSVLRCHTPTLGNRESDEFTEVLFYWVSLHV